jgi:hypothetical protein
MQVTGSEMAVPKALMNYLKLNPSRDGDKTLEQIGIRK